MRKKIIIGGVMIALLLGATTAYILVQPQYNHHTLLNSTYRLEVADTAARQQKGLSDRDSLPDDAGMLFPYNEVAERCFWMKDMQFSIDIIWAGSDKRVTHIESNVSPASYPRSYCYPAQYVIELNAGEAEKSEVLVGKRLDF